MYRMFVFYIVFEVFGVKWGALFYVVFYPLHVCWGIVPIFCMVFVLDTIQGIVFVFCRILGIIFVFNFGVDTVFGMVFCIVFYIVSNTV